VSSEGAKLLQDMIDRALAPLEELHERFARIEPGEILTCGDRQPLIRYSSGYEVTPLSRLKVVLGATGRSALLSDERGRSLSAREIVKRHGVAVGAAEYERLAAAPARTR
jgi:hypothetical protein